MGPKASLSHDINVRVSERQHPAEIQQRVTRHVSNMHLKSMHRSAAGETTPECKAKTSATMTSADEAAANHSPEQCVPDTSSAPPSFQFVLATNSMPTVFVASELVQWSASKGCQGKKTITLLTSTACCVAGPEITSSCGKQHCKKQMRCLS